MTIEQRADQIAQLRERSKSAMLGVAVGEFDAVALAEEVASRGFITSLSGGVLYVENDHGQYDHAFQAVLS